MDRNSLKATEAVVVEKAEIEDVPTIQLMVKSAYTKYIERIGKLPAPMTADYDKLFETHDVYVLRVNRTVVGSIVLSIEGDSIQINNVVVHPSYQSRGYGRLLMSYAENMARARGLRAVTLYTNEKMYENIALYAKIGFTEIGRKMENGFNRVFFCKRIA